LKNILEKNGIALQGEPSYEVGPADDGSVFKCVDKTHANYNGGQSNLTSQEKKITVFCKQTVFTS